MAAPPGVGQVPSWVRPAGRFKPGGGSTFPGKAGPIGFVFPRSAMLAWVRLVTGNGAGLGSPFPSDAAPASPGFPGEMGSRSSSFPGKVGPIGFVFPRSAMLAWVRLVTGSGAGLGSPFPSDAAPASPGFPGEMGSRSSSFPGKVGPIGFVFPRSVAGPWVRLVTGNEAELGSTFPGKVGAIGFVLLRTTFDGRVRLDAGDGARLGSSFRLVPNLVSTSGAGMGPVLGSTCLGKGFGSGGRLSPGK